MVVSKALVKFIKDRLRLGHAVDDIRLQLIKRGYKARDVEEAIAEAEKKKKREINFWLWAVIVLAVLIVLVFVLMKILPEEAPPAKPPEVPFEAPEEIPEVLPKEEAAEVTKIPPEILPEVPEEIPVTKPVILPRADFNLTPKLEFIRERSLTNPDAASAMCTEFDLVNERDVCFITVAKGAQDSNLCERISDIMIKDQCYFSFAVLKQNVCDKITGSETRQACERLIALNFTLS